APERNTDLITRDHVDRAVRSTQLLDGNLTFGLVSDVDDREVLADRDHRPLEDIALLGFLLFQALFEESGKALVVLAKASGFHDVAQASHSWGRISAWGAWAPLAGGNMYASHEGLSTTSLRLTWGFARVGGPRLA